MLRAVVDTNVVVSALLNAFGTPASVVGAASDRYKLVWSAGIVTECLRVLAYEKIARRLRAIGKEEEARAMVARLASGAVLVSPELLPRIRVVTDDPSDDLFLATALAGGARVLVSGDRRHLLPLNEFMGVRIVDPATFAAELGLPGTRHRKGPAGAVHEPVAGYEAEDALAELAREAKRWARTRARPGSQPSAPARVTGRPSAPVRPTPPRAPDNAETPRRR